MRMSGCVDVAVLAHMRLVRALACKYGPSYLDIYKAALTWRKRRNMRMSVDDILDTQTCILCLASAWNIFALIFLPCFPILAMLVYCCLKDLSRVRGKMVTLSNQVSLRIEMAISTCLYKITIILSSK